jgi:hypothetical protein
MHTEVNINLDELVNITSLARKEKLKISCNDYESFKIRFLILQSSYKSKLAFTICLSFSHSTDKNGLQPIFDLNDDLNGINSVCACERKSEDLRNIQ